MLSPERHVPAGDTGGDDAVADARRIMGICNACRYCEGYCGVFPAMERRLEFASADLRYLANLCHNCGACYTACQYAPPHEFAVNVPIRLAQIRTASYREYAWPAVLGRLFERPAAAATLLSLVFSLVFVLGVVLLNPAGMAARGQFYDVMPHSVMAGTFGLVGLFVLAAFGAALLRFWRDTGEPWSGLLDLRAIGRAASDALRLRYLGGGGEGCDAAAERPSTLRRRYHHLVAYGFLLCFAATVTGTVYHYLLGWPAPYPLTSLPVVLGTVGGVGIVVGCVGLWWMGRRRDPALAGPQQRGADQAFIALLLATSVTGLLLLALRETGAMWLLLSVHLGVVMALFVTLPYGKFIHAVHRFAALQRHALEQRRPMPHTGGE